MAPHLLLLLLAEVAKPDRRVLVAGRDHLSASAREVAEHVGDDEVAQVRLASGRARVRLRNGSTVDFIRDAQGLRGCSVDLLLVDDWAAVGFPADAATVVQARAGLVVS